MRPQVLPPNLPETFYRGAGRIAGFRGDRFGPVRADRPEDWIASTVTRFGEARAGLTELPDGGLLRDAIDADPDRWLGPGRFGIAPPSLTVPLVKYLDAGQRLPVHVHPDDAFAQSRLGAAQGKTEAWLIMEAPPGALVHLGWRREMPRATLAGLVRGQDVPAMLEAMNPVHVAAGDVVVVPAGTPHAIGEGIFLTEVQQAADLSILLEWRPFLPDDSQAYAGADLDVALGCVDVAPLSADVVEELIRRDAPSRARTGAVVDLIPEAAAEFFRGFLLRAGSVLPAGYATLVVLNGSGTLRGADWDVEVERGMTLTVPHAAGDLEVGGDITAVAFTPPRSTSGDLST